MHPLRFILLFIALLAPAGPVTVALSAQAKMSCPMSCCAENDVGCACLAEKDASRLPAPANIPFETGRDFAPQMAVIVLSQSCGPQIMAMSESCASKLALDDHDDQRGVPRLTVLHCTFVI